MSLHNCTGVYFRNLRTCRAIKDLIQPEMLLLSTGVSVCILLFPSFFRNNYCKGEINTRSLDGTTSLTQRKVILKISLSFGQESEETLRTARHFSYYSVW